MHKIDIKTQGEVEIMHEGGIILGKIRDDLANSVKIGSTGLQLEKMACDLIDKSGGKASFKMVKGYSWATCINVNDTVVHGIPNGYKFKTGDIVGIDVGIFYKGFHTDTSVTVEVGSNKQSKFLDTGRLSVKKAIAKAKIGNRIADISKAMQDTVEEKGFSAVRALTGHGIGRFLHEEPPVPCFVVGKYENSPRIEAGMVIAIEIMYNLGTSDVMYNNDDGWTIVTADGKISGLFEETVAITKSGPLVLTQTKN